MDPQWHVVVDTNVLHFAAAEEFEFFHTLQHTQQRNVVVVVPFAVVEELDWQKDVSKNEAKSTVARRSSNFLNKHLASGSSFLVVQTLEEDKASRSKHDTMQGSFNIRADMRIVDCAAARQEMGLKVMLVSGDTNVRNTALAAGMSAVTVQSLWRMMCCLLHIRLGPERWVKAIRDMEQHRLARQQRPQGSSSSVAAGGGFGGGGGGSGGGGAGGGR